MAGLACWSAYMLQGFREGTTINPGQGAIIKEWDEPTDQVFGAGTPWLRPWQSLIPPQDIQDVVVDPEVIVENARDGVPVETDDMMIFAPQDLLKRMARIGDPKQGLEGELKSATSHFVKIWYKGLEARFAQDQLQAYLALPADKEAPQHAKFRQTMERLRLRDDGTERFSANGFDGLEGLMDKAGSLVGLAESWGLELKKTDVKSMRPPKAYIDASITSAKQETVNEGLRARNKIRKEMALDFVAADTTNRLDFQTALNYVDRSFDYGVKTEIKEFHVRDLDLFVENISKMGDSALAQAAKAAAEAWKQQQEKSR